MILYGEMISVFQASFDDRCFLSLEEGSVYDLNITSPQSESYNRIYRFFTPSEHLLTDQGLSPPPAAI